VIEFLEEGLVSSYTMIIAKAFKSNFELSHANVKLEVLNNWEAGQATEFVVFSDM